jgi:sugar lactone lactonase YvrE
VTRLGRADLLVADAGDLCEGPRWDDRAGTLVWVDILAGAVHVLSPRTAERRTHRLRMPVGAVAPRRRGGWVAAVERGFLLLDDKWQPTGPVLAAPGQPAGTRFNDGACTPRGEFWAGTLAYDGTRGVAALYRLGPDGRVSEVLGGVTNSNGIGWSPDGATMYYVDTGLGTVDRFDVDPVTGLVSGRTTLIQVAEDDGLPDGLTVDAEGHLWLALWGGGCVRRYAPSGALEAVVELPVALVTSLTFGGDELDELFITTARQGLTPAQRRAQPLAGSIFRHRPGVTGIRVAAFAG